MRENCKLLTEAELPVLVRPAYDLSAQKLVERADLPGYHKLYILRRCLRCKAEEWVAVNHVRSAIRSQTLTGYCARCVTQRDKPGRTARRRYLAEDELPDSLQSAFDVNSQRIDGARGLVITRVCSACQKKEAVPVAWLRQKIKLGRLRGLCQDCYKIPCP